MTDRAEPLPVAETFTFADEDGVSLSDVAKLDTMVTVVDAVNFMKDYEAAKMLQETGESLGEDDERSVADLLVDQVEFAWHEPKILAEWPSDDLRSRVVFIVRDLDEGQLRKVLAQLLSRLRAPSVQGL